MALNRKRVAGAGLMVRVSSFTINGLVLVLTLVYLAEWWGRPFSVWSANAVFALGFAVLCAAVIARSCVIGATLMPGVVVVRSWLVTRRVPTSQIVSSASAPYSGLFNWANSDGSGKWLKMLVLIRTDGKRPIPVRGTIAFRAASERQSQAINEFLLLPVAPEGGSEAGGVSHRRSRWGDTPELRTWNEWQLCERRPTR
jgi:hypothetical protein